MDYIYYIATFAGGAWTGYLIGQFSSVKEMNRRLNALVQQNKRAEELLDDTENKNTDLQCEVDRLSDLVSKYQRNKPEREANGKFASKKKRVTAELAAYVASKAA